MRRVSRLRAIAVIAALAAAGAAFRTSAGAQPARSGLGADALRAPFSAALEAALPEHTRDLVSIVAADIDDDGDLDVVANDASLNLFIWLNDGAGHFTRQRPAHSNAWRGQPADPAVGGGAATFDIPTQTSQPSPHLARGSASVRLAARDSRLRAGPALVAVAAASTRVPRAPPARLAV